MCNPIATSHLVTYTFMHVHGYIYIYNIHDTYIYVYDIDTQSRGAIVLLGGPTSNVQPHCHLPPCHIQIHVCAWVHIYIYNIYGTYIYVYYIYTRSRGAIVLLDGPYCSNISHCLKSVQSFLISACLIHLKQSTGFFHRIRMQGLDILNLAKQLPEVLEHLRRSPLLLAILATDPPKSSSLYVQVSLGILLSEVM